MRKPSSSEINNWSSFLGQINWIVWIHAETYGTGSTWNRLRSLQIWENEKMPEHRILGDDFCSARLVLSVSLLCKSFKLAAEAIKSLIIVSASKTESLPDFLEERPTNMRTTNNELKLSKRQQKFLKGKQTSHSCAHGSNVYSALPALLHSGCPLCHPSWLQPSHLHQSIDSFLQLQVMLKPWQPQAEIPGGDKQEWQRLATWELGSTL